MLLENYHTDVLIDLCNHRNKKSQENATAEYFAEYILKLEDHFKIELLHFFKLFCILIGVNMQCPKEVLKRTGNLYKVKQFLIIGAVYTR